uniref:Uncharacterized protein n=1 Tax=Anguilla anguilla TaxID=7936 RepID=A0A0E9VAQ4_ANGAN
MWTQAMKASLKFTFSHRTSGPNCFFLSVESRVISSLSAFISPSLYWKSRTVNLNSLALCLKSSMAFLKRVTLKRPLSWSSNSRLVDRGTTISARVS